MKKCDFFGIMPKFLVWAYKKLKTRVLLQISKKVSDLDFFSGSCTQIISLFDEDDPEIDMGMLKAIRHLQYGES